MGGRGNVLNKGIWYTGTKGLQKPASSTINHIAQETLIYTSLVAGRSCSNHFAVKIPAHKVSHWYCKFFYNASSIWPNTYLWNRQCAFQNWVSPWNCPMFSTAIQIFNMNVHLRLYGMCYVLWGRLFIGRKIPVPWNQFESFEWYSAKCEIIYKEQKLLQHAKGCFDIIWLAL